MATDYSYTYSGNNADLVRAIKDYALYLFFEGEEFTPPTSVDWTPPDGKLPVGYNSEDGATLHPEPGDDTEINAHNGDVVYSETSPGYWTLQFVGLEGKKQVVELYTNSTVDAQGGVHVKDASTGKIASMVLVGLDQKERPVLVYAEKTQVSDRDDVTFKSTDLLMLNITLKMFKGKDGYQWHAWGLVLDESEKLVQTVSADPTQLSVEAGKTGTFMVRVTPEDATNADITVTSTDETKATATVTEKTVTVTGVAATDPGKPVTITATAGGKSVNVPITVTAPTLGDLTVTASALTDGKTVLTLPTPDAGNRLKYKVTAADAKPTVVYDQACGDDAGWTGVPDDKTVAGTAGQIVTVVEVVETGAKARKKGESAPLA